LHRRLGGLFSKSWRIKKEKNWSASGYGIRLVQPIATELLQRKVVMAGVVISRTTGRTATKTAIGCMCRPLQITMKSYTEIFVISFGYVLEHKILKIVKLHQYNNLPRL
jgi:hypothetical protein